MLVIAEGARDWLERHSSESPCRVSPRYQHLLGRFVQISVRLLCYAGIRVIGTAAGDGLLPTCPGTTAPAKSALSARTITALRQKLGLTKAALARRIGINVNTLWRWERGDRKPHGLHRKLIADLLRDSN